MANCTVLAHPAVNVFNRFPRKCHVPIHCLAENLATQVFNQMFNTVNNIIACNCTQ